MTIPIYNDVFDAKKHDQIAVINLGHRNNSNVPDDLKHIKLPSTIRVVNMVSASSSKSVMLLADFLDLSPHSQKQKSSLLLDFTLKRYIECVFSSANDIKKNRDCALIIKTRLLQTENPASDEDEYEFEFEKKSKILKL